MVGQCCVLSMPIRSGAGGFSEAARLHLANTTRWRLLETVIGSLCKHTFFLETRMIENTRDALLPDT